MGYVQINVKEHREEIYATRGVVCESCGEVWDGAGRRFPIHHWSYDPLWYQEGHYSVLCPRGHALITNRSKEVWARLLGLDGGRGETPAPWWDEKERCVRILLKKWWPIYSA